MYSPVFGLREALQPMRGGVHKPRVEGLVEMHSALSGLRRHLHALRRTDEPKLVLCGTSVRNLRGHL